MQAIEVIAAFKGSQLCERNVNRNEIVASRVTDGFSCPANAAMTARSDALRPALYTRYFICLLAVTRGSVQTDVSTQAALVKRYTVAQM